MTPEQQQRLDFLAHGSCAPIEYISDYYGLSWPFVDGLAHDYQLFESQARRQAACAVGQASRFLIESFMQRKHVVSKKWMGARLGMTEESLDVLLTRIDELGLRPQRYVVYPEMIADSLQEDIVPALRGLRFRTFSDHVSFCQRLHASLRDELGMEVQALFCVTSVAVNDYPRQFANNFDCLTLLPLSGRHQVWLDFHKPMNLAPDRCSKLFYFENHDFLEPYRAGNREPDLAAYGQFIGGHGDDA
ncbi:MAG: hypothetical protein ABSG68_10010 [Thermoguttaceae bacterium]|jgi:hypothetical protein